ncbi:MAG: methionyl-tRNA formyltransferase [Kiritimatiellaeota bacterium]|nr:methionyl-tRNA formyltransferase [Kiritimatiellota bacterium]
MRRLKIILCGQRSFGAAALDMLAATPHEVAAVYAPEGDKLHRRAALAGYAVNPGGRLASTGMPSADLLVAAHAHDYVSRPARDRLTLGAIGYHPSLLPLHRGRDAAVWAVRMGDRVTGGTVFWLGDTVDGGDILTQDWCLIRPGETASALWRDRLFPMGIRLLREALAEIASGTLTRIPQDHSLATWEPSLTGAPRLHRPELQMIGTLPEGYAVRREMCK